MLMKRLAYTESEQLIGIDFIHFGGEFGKDVDLESQQHRRTSLHSERDDIESNDGRSQNSNFVEEFSTTDNDKAPASTQILPQSSNGSSLEFNHRSMRAVSSSTLEGRKIMHHELRRVLDEDPRVRHRFRAYLEVMHREEGVAFWDEVVRWKTISSKRSTDKKIREARRIIKTYCMESGTKQVNLASKELKILMTAMDEKDELLNNKLFDSALEELFKDLKLAFMEFVDSTPNYWI